MAGMHHALILTSRIVAGIVAAVAFYFAFFLYENEEGVWQNRIENLWATIDDRSKVTQSTSVALFNKISETLDNVFDRLFGKRLLSFHALAVSVNLSIVGALLKGVRLVVSDRSLLHISSGRVYLSVNPTLVFPADRLYLSVILALVLFGAFAVIPISCSRPWATLFGSLPLISLVILLLFCLGIMVFSTVTEVDVGFFVGMIVVVALSFACDVTVIIVVRKALRMVAHTLSLVRLFVAIFGLLALSALLTYVPLHEFGDPDEAPISGGFASTVLSEVGSFNIATALMCQIPALVLCVVLLHRWIWPVFGRLLYPVASRRIVTNRKLLVPVGSLCLLYAMVPGDVGLKDVLKLLS
jgi:hypothetical protein